MSEENNSRKRKMEEEDICSICFEAIAEEDVFLLPCGHGGNFHRECLATLCRTHGVNDLCPL